MTGAGRWLWPLALVIALGSGWLARGWLAPGSAHDMNAMPSAELAGTCPGGAQPLYWKAPMDPTFVRHGPGKSPMGMDLVPECPKTGAPPADGAVQLDPSIVQKIGVRTALVETRDLRRKIRALGRVAYDERRLAHVHTKVQGWAEKLFIDYVGQRVKRGQPLLEIYSPELVATQEELLLAARYRDSTQASSYADVSEGGEALFEATRRRLQLWDVSDRDIERIIETGKIRKTLTLHAPTNGVVTELGVREGMEIDPTQNLYTIADLSRIWLLADVYEFELPWVSLGLPGSVELGSLPGERFSGELSYIAPFVDPRTRTVEVRLELDNAEGKLKPEMFGNVTIESEPRSQVTAIPSDAVLRSGRRTVVAVALGEGRFEPREIEIGMDAGDGWLEVTQGLTSGERVVVSAQFLIDSESRLQTAVQRLLEGASEPTPMEAGDPPTSEPPPMSHEGMSHEDMGHMESMGHHGMDH